MKTKSILTAILCCMSICFATEASANSWRVNYDKRANADFLDLNAAMASELVSDGDTLYLDKGSTFSTEQTITKSVTLIGPGYFIGENDADEAYFSNTMNLEAENIKITGLHTSAINIKASNAVIERCRVTGNIRAVEKYENDNVAIRSCFIVGTIYGNGENGSDNWQVTNNIFYGNGSNCMGSVIGFMNVLIDHNLIVNKFWGSGTYYSIDATNSTITNNIIYSERVNYGDRSCNIRNFTLSYNNIISHNVLSCSKESNFPNNKYGILLTSIKQEGAEGRESYFALSDESAAKGYAIDGSDCGPYAGAYPYVLSGYPLYVPRFVSIDVPSQPDAEGKLHINLIIKNQNK